MRAVSPWRNAAQATWDEIGEGILKTRAASAMLYSAYVDLPIQTTRSLTLRLREASWGEGPSETTRPDPSWPKISGLGELYRPVRK